MDLSFCKDCFLFRDLAGDELALVGGMFVEKTLPEGKTVFVEQMPGESLYLIREGTVRISKMLTEADEKTLVILGPEDVFGEMAILDGLPRAATARVIEAARLLCLRKTDFDALCLKRPALGLKLMRNIIRVFSRRVRDNSADYRQMLIWATEGASD
jgi:CRP-like cAMP-binding protein